MASSIKTSVKMIAMLRVWCWISLKIRLCPEAFLCPNLGNCLFQIQGVSELLWCIKLSYFAENRWCPNINGVRKYMVNTVAPKSQWKFNIESDPKPEMLECPSVCLSHFCPEHISKSIEGNLMKLDTLIEGHNRNCRRTIILSPVFTELLPLIFAIKSLSGAYLWKYGRELNETWYIDIWPSEELQSARNVTLSQVVTELFPFLVFAIVSLSAYL